MVHETTITMEREKCKFDVQTPRRMEKKMRRMYQVSKKIGNNAGGARRRIMADLSATGEI